MAERGPTKPERRRILVVEDEEILRSMASDILGEFGYTSTLASTGEEALALLGDDPGGFGVVMIDLRLPGLTGAETCRQIRTLHPSVAIIAMSGLDLTSSRCELEGIEVVEILTKPFRMAQMVEAIERAAAGVPP